LRPWYRLARLQGRFALEYGRVAIVLEGAATERLVPALLPLLDGRRTVPEIVARLGPNAEPAILGALEQLAEHRLLTEGPPDGDETAAFLASTLDLAPAEAAGRLRAVRLGVVGDGPLATEVAAALVLEDARPPVVAGWDGPTVAVDLVVVAPSPAELPRLEAWNELALERGTRWLQVLPPNGRFAALGPLFVPDETCCRACFQLRQAASLEYRSELAELEATPARFPSPPTVTRTVAALAALLAVRWAVGGDFHLAGAFYALELGFPLSLGLHRVYRVPRCPDCSGLDGAAPPSPWFSDGVVGR
jgi:bacteriocin biosynthesis cyclodehydratase domain-containing protein